MQQIQFVLTLKILFLEREGRIKGTKKITFGLVESIESSRVHICPARAGTRAAVLWIMHAGEERSLAEYYQPRCYLPLLRPPTATWSCTRLPSYRRPRTNSTAFHHGVATSARGDNNRDFLIDPNRALHSLEMRFHCWKKPWSHRIQPLLRSCFAPWLLIFRIMSSMLCHYRW